ncbi:MAG: carboxylating nicotinate-nucleotide diphosphorylase [Terriglobales bacterium]|jgi:nicotinate-nucleotide pyrophosphorylase (carboxylating)
MSKSPDPSTYRELLRRFLAEDFGAGDITTNTIVSADRSACGELFAKAPLVLAGVDLFLEVFRLLEPAMEAKIGRTDGDELRLGDIPLQVFASARTLLSGERVALNLLQRLSGIATLTRRYVREVEGTGAQILDTRKTTPGLRALEKYAVRVGGGRNHRKDLAEAVLIKENHIRMAGGVAAALRAAQPAQGRVAWMEIEVTNFDELRDALVCRPDVHRPDVILLDNMQPADVRQAVEQARLAESAQHRPASSPEKKVLLEASGGITLANVRQFAETGVDWISVGALTHSAPAVDLSFEIEPI